MSEKVVDDLADVIRNNTALEELYLGSNDLQSSAVVVFQALKGIKKLNLYGNNMSGKVVDDLADVIRNNTDLKELYLCNNALQSSAVVVLQALKGISTLKKLSLYGNNMSGKVVNDLADVFKNNTRLELVSLGRNNLQSSAVVILQALKGISTLKSLYLYGNNMSGKVVGDLSEVIKNNICLEEINLGNNDLQSSAVVILQALKGISTLKILSLYGNSMSRKVVDDLSDVIKNNICLEEIDLGRNNLQSSAVVILQAMKGILNLKKLFLEDNNMSEKVVDDLADVIRNNTALEELYLGNNDLQSSAVVVLQALKGISTLKKLSLYGNNMSRKVADDLSDVIKNNICLEEIDLGSNNLQSSAVVILQALKGISTLKSLYLYSNNMSGKVVGDLSDVIKNNIYLEEINLGNNNLQSSVVVILQVMKGISNLKKLFLQDNNMSEKVVDDLADIIRNNTGLEELYLGNNDLQSSAVVVFQALRGISTLKKLNLYGNNMSGKVVNDLADVFKSNTRLELVSLGRNNLQSSAVVILQAMKGISNLKELFLQDNNMSEKVVDDLADVIRNNTGLEELYLCNNDLQSSTVVVFQALKGISTLKKLNLYGNNMSGKVVNDLADVLKNNTCLEVLGLGNNNLLSSVLVILQALKRKSNLKALYLGSNFISRIVIDDLAEVIRNNNCLKHLNLFNNNLHSSAVVVLQALETVSTLESLDLDDNNMSKEVVDSLTHVICNNKLSGLCIGGNSLQTGLNVVSSIYLKQISSLEIVFANDNNFSAAAVEGLVATLSGNSKLKELWIGGNALQNGIIDITEVCVGLPNLEALELSRSSCSVPVTANLVSVISNAISLRALMFSGITLNNTELFSIQCFKEMHNYSDKKRDFSDSDLLEVVSLMMQKYQFTFYIKYSYHNSDTKFPTIVQIFKFVNVIQQFLQHSSPLPLAKIAQQKLYQIDSTLITSTLIDTFQRLKVLDLEFSNIGKCASSKLAEGLCCNDVLEQLWLRGNVLHDEGAAPILNSLQNNTTLRVLDLSYNNISSKSSDGIAAVVSSNQFLEQLWLDGNCLQTYGILRIAGALIKHFKLRLLSLSGNEMTEDSANAISEIVTRNILLEDLILSNNQLQSSGICKFAEALFNLKQLRKLDLSHTKITVDCVAHLAVVIRHSANLQELYLGNNMLGNTAVIKVLTALRSVSLLRVLSLSNNNLTKKAVRSICDVINKQFALNILLLGGNDLQTGGVLQITEAVQHNEAVQLLALCDNNVDNQTKKNIMSMLSSNPDLYLYI